MTGRRLDERAHAGPEHLDPGYVVHSRHALHHLPEFWKVVLARIHDLLAPGGVLILRDLVYDFEPAEADRRIEAWLAGAAPTPAEGWTRRLLEPLLTHAGFEIVERDVGGEIYATYVCRRS